MYLMMLSEVAGVVNGKQVVWEAERFRQAFRNGNQELFWVTDTPRDFRFSKQYRQYVWDLRS